MKTNYRLIVKHSSVTLLIILVFVFTQCGVNTDQIGSSNSSPGKILNPGKQDEGQIINNMEVAEGIKSHEQIFYTMSALTSVPVTNNDVRNAYNQVATSLPSNNDLKVFLAPHQLAITKLAAEFCNVLVENPGFRINVWPTYAGFNLTPDIGLSAENRQIIIQELILSFWGGVISEDEHYAAQEEMKLLMNELLVDENMNSSATTRNVIKGVCTVALSSAHVTIF